VLSHVAGPNNFLGQTEAKARYSLLQSLARIWLQQNRIHRSYLEELLSRRKHSRVTPQSPIVSLRYGPYGFFSSLPTSMPASMN